MSAEPRRNWAGNYTYHATALHQPESVEQIAELVTRSEKVRVLGTRHSFNEIADTTGDQISLERLDRMIGIDAARGTVTVEGGVRYGNLGQYLHQHGYALRNMASLPHISIAVACATATHGSGVQNGNLATSVVGMEMVTSDGKIANFSR